jgi:hypothetical protein
MTALTGRNSPVNDAGLAVLQVWSQFISLPTRQLRVPFELGCVTGRLKVLALTILEFRLEK